MSFISNVLDFERRESLENHSRRLPGQTRQRDIPDLEKGVDVALQTLGLGPREGDLHAHRLLREQSGQKLLVGVTMMAPLPICHWKQRRRQTLLTFTPHHFITLLLMTFTRDAAGCARPKVGSGARFGGGGSGPAMRVNTSRLLGAAASPWVPRGGLQGRQDVGEAVTSHLSKSIITVRMNDRRD